jgi:hypothetical protein
VNPPDNADREPESDFYVEGTLTSQTIFTRDDITEMIRVLEKRDTAQTRLTDKLAAMSRDEWKAFCKDLFK